MSDYNLTERERQLLIQILDLSKHSKDHFEATIVNPAAPEGPARELARLMFGGGSLPMDLTKRDLRVLKDEGFIHFRWDHPHRGTGRLSSLALQAVTARFQLADDGAADTAAADAATVARLAVIADEKAIAHRFQKITTQLVNLAGQLIDADEALSAEREAMSIAEQLARAEPDETVTIRKIKGFVGRLSLTFSGTADLALKGELIGEFAERLAAWLVALSVWTEWHAAHRPPKSKPLPTA